MLSQLCVRDFAIVDKVDIEFDAGMTVLTGETGAGKSILVDALSLAIGERARTEVIRAGAERTDVTASFDISECPQAQCWLREQALDEGDGECIVRRTVGNDGRSRAYVNARPVPVNTLRALGELLVDIHGQHAHQSLLRRGAQREMLDVFADHTDLTARVTQLARQWAGLNREHTELTGGQSGQEARLELLRYQLQELEVFAPAEGESGRLEHELKRLTNVTAILEACTSLLDQLSGDSDQGVLSILQSGARELDELPDDDPRLLGAGEMLDNAGIQLQEAINDLRDYTHGLQPDPERLAEAEARLTLAHDLARKHRTQPDELHTLVARLASELDAIESGEARVDEIARQMDAVATEYHTGASALSASRQKAATRLSHSTSKQMAELGMPGSEFLVNVRSTDTPAIAAHGSDEVEFVVSTNPGQPCVALAKVVSGGELSRISLALQVICTQGTGVPTVIFDEVDVGIGGRVAETVGRHLHELARHRQVLCVTHLPQVASQGDSHVQVHKQAVRKKIHTTFERLEAENRVDEIARMLGGVKITARTRAHARELLGKG